MREAYEPVAGQGISDSDVPDQEVVHGRPCERDVVADEERRFLGRRTRQPGYVPFRQHQHQSWYQVKCLPRGYEEAMCASQQTRSRPHSHR